MTVVNTSDNRYGVAQLIVAPTIAQGANFTTITAALAAAVSGQTIFIRPGTYTEGNLTLKAGVNLSAFDCDALTPNVIILGNCTATFAGTCSLSGIELRTNGANCLTVTGSNATIVNLFSCFIRANNATAININNANCQLNIRESFADIATTGIAIFTITNINNLNCYYFFAQNNGNSTTTNTIAAGEAVLWWSHFENPTTTSSTAVFSPRWCRFFCFGINQTALIHNATASGSQCFECVFSGGTATAITVGSGADLRLLGGTVSSTNATAISGNGSIKLSGINYQNTSDLTISTEDYQSNGPRIQLGGTGTCQLICGSGSPSGVVTAPKGSLYLRSDGSSSSTRAYVNTSGGTSWTNIVTAS